ncbi:hypothetical protein LB531_22080 [Mesorhizobium sp. CO1-1-2]|uniref:hypothetical protein n=1 Tax=Mesorhizobium sp. CO1-1-2 TaxID=2876635 RepID=UPI001CCB9CDE|nr:hypothetical protein [Mesorhizobium sp. CO1-1-2]MBZ9683347.1 hypothetical protein [Mesorhizobium sp. CO1-1-2]
MTSRIAAKRSAITGGVLLLGCLVWSACLEHTVAPNPIRCDDRVPATLADGQGALIADGKLQLLEVWPQQTAINHAVCIVVAGVVPQTAEVHLADEINRARKTREVAQLGFDTAAASARDAAWTTLQAADTALQKALTAAAAQPQPVTLSVFLNGKTAPDLTVQAQARSGQQALLFRLEVPNDAGKSGATFWRDLLSAQVPGGDWTKIGQKALAVGLSRSATTLPDTKTAPIAVMIYNPVTLGVGIASLLCFAVSFWGLARQTTMLRDNKRMGNMPLIVAQKAHEDAEAVLEKADVAATAANDAVAEAKVAVTSAAVGAADALVKATAESAAAQAAVVTAAAAAGDAAKALQAAQAKADEAKKASDAEQPLGPYSLARTQMAFWMFLTVGGFVFIWLTMGIYLGLITGGILVLLGINATSGLAAISLDDDGDKTSTSNSFFLDILNDGNGPALHRIQALAWTCILGILFVWNVVWNFTFINFDTNLLLLVGVAQSMYLGFKWKEPPASKK